MSTALKRLTVDEYLLIERAATEKSEFFDGEVFAMSGGSARHSLISGNVIGALWAALKGRCHVHTSDMRIKSPLGLYTYADAAVVCGADRCEGKSDDVLLNPTLVVEVLSPSTEAYDRGRKFQHYRSIDSLRTFILVSQEERLVEVFSRDDNDRWILTEFTEGLVQISQPDCELAVDDIYDQVLFTEPDATESN